MEFKTSKPLGQILKAHGKQGELIISFTSEYPQDFHHMESIFIEIDGGVVPFFLTHVINKTPTTAIIKLEDIDTLDEAQRMSGLTWYLPADATGKAGNEASPDLSQLEGYTLIDQNDGPIGLVENYTDIPSNALLQVRYKQNLVDIPVNEQTLYYIDPEKQVIKIEIPEGLLEL